MAVKKLAENTYRISEWGAFGLVKMYLLIGNERALLIDSGYGKIDLKSGIVRHHAGGVRGKAQGADFVDEKGDCGNQGKRKKRGLTITVSP